MNFFQGDLVEDIHGERGKVIRQKPSGTVVVRVWAENVDYDPDHLTVIKRAGDGYESDDLPEQVTDEE